MQRNEDQDDVPGKKSLYCLKAEWTDLTAVVPRWWNLRCTPWKVLGEAGSKIQRCQHLKMEPCGIRGWTFSSAPTNLAKHLTMAQNQPADRMKSNSFRGLLAVSGSYTLFFLQ